MVKLVYNIKNNFDEKFNLLSDQVNNISDQVNNISEDVYYLSEDVYYLSEDVSCLYKKVDELDLKLTDIQTSINWQFEITSRHSIGSLCGTRYAECIVIRTVENFIDYIKYVTDQKILAELDDRKQNLLSILTQVYNDYFKTDLTSIKDVEFFQLFNHINNLNTEEIEINLCGNITYKLGRNSAFDYHIELGEIKRTLTDYSFIKPKDKSKRF